MKNLVKTSLVAIGLMISLSTLSIVDMQGLALYKEAIEQNGFYSKGFDLTTLPKGDYFFELN